MKLIQLSMSKLTNISRKIFKKVKHLIINEEWAICYRKIENKGSIFEHNINLFQPIKNSALYWYADPFIFERDGNTFIFCEMFNKITRKGDIGYCRLDESKPIIMKRIIKEKWHLSYPYIYSEDEIIYIMPESIESRSLYRYMAIDFPEVWLKEDSILENVQLADPTLYNAEDIEYLFACDANYKTPTNSKLLVYSRYRNQDKSIDNLSATELIDAASARPAGNLFYHNGMLIRPGQDCSKTYGAGVVFNQVLAINPKQYQEKAFFYINPESNLVNCKHKYNGIHTYNKGKNYEVIDIKYYRFNLFAAIGRSIIGLQRRVNLILK